MATENFFKVWALPAAVRNCLSHIGYHKKDIRAVVKDMSTFTEIVGRWDGGQQTTSIFIQVSNIGVTYTVGHGSTYATLYVSQPVFDYWSQKVLQLGDDAQRVAYDAALDSGVTPVTAAALAKSHPVGAPDTPLLTQNQQRVLNAFSELNSKGRKRQCDNWIYEKKMTRDDIDNAIAVLVARRLFKMTASGAIQVTTEGKNCRTRDLYY